MLSNNLLQEAWKGVGSENPVLRLVLGLCPVLGVSAYLINGLGMGLAVTAVLLCSNLVISLIRGYISYEYRLATYLVIIASFVTAADMLMRMYQPDLREALGIFLPLMAVNCIVLTRAETFSSNQPVGRSVMDGLGMGIGFTLALLVLSGVREILGTGSITAVNTVLVEDIFGANFEPIRMFEEPFGAFVALGLLLALVNMLYNRKQNPA